jgi:hypothetical protein
MRVYVIYGAHICVGKDHGGTYRAALRSLHGAEPYEDGSGTLRVSQYPRRRPPLGTVVKNPEVTVSTYTPRVDDTLRDTLVVKAVDLFPSNLVLEQRSTWSVTIGRSKPVGSLAIVSIVDIVVAYQLSVSETLTPWSVVNTEFPVDSTVSRCRSLIFAVSVKELTTDVAAAFAREPREDILDKEKNF